MTLIENFLIQETLNQKYQQIQSKKEKNILDLTQEQFEEIKNFFNSRPHLEPKLGEILNNKNIYEKFLDIKNKYSNNITKGNIKTFGKEKILGEENKDYFNISINDDIIALIPLNYEFQKYIQNDDFFYTEGKWCIGTQGTSEHWDRYNENSDFIIFIRKSDGLKLAMQILKDFCIFWNSSDYKSQTIFYDSVDLKNVKIEYKSSAPEIGNIEKDFVNNDIIPDIYKYLDNFDSAICNISVPKNLIKIPVFKVENNVAIFDYFSSSKKENNSYYFKKRRVKENFNGDIIEECWITEESFPDNSFEEINFGDLNITRIDDFSFYENELLYKIKIPKTVLSIGENAFEKCESLSYVVINGPITILKEKTFYKCEYLSEILLPSSLTRIENSCFEDCYSLQDIIFPNNLIHIGEKSFCNTGIEELSLNNIEYVGNNAFDGCSYLKKVYISDELQFLPSSCFYGCKKLEMIDLDYSIETIDYNCFFDCESLKTVILGNSIEKIENGAFGNCYDLKNINMPKYLGYLGKDIFYGTDGINVIFNDEELKNSFDEKEWGNDNVNIIIKKYE